LVPLCLFQPAVRQCLPSPSLSRIYARDRLESQGTISLLLGDSTTPTDWSQHPTCFHLRYHFDISWIEICLEIEIHLPRHLFCLIFLCVYMPNFIHSRPFIPPRILGSTGYIKSLSLPVPSTQTIPCQDPVPRPTS